LELYHSWLGIAALARHWRTVFSVVASLVLFDTWFYWLHRLIHTRFFTGACIGGTI